MTTTLSGPRCSLLSRFTLLRSAAFGVSSEIGATFASDAANGWRERGLSGLGAACWSLQQILGDMPGTYAPFAEARSLAVAFSAQGEGSYVREAA